MTHIQKYKRTKILSIILLVNLIINILAFFTAHAEAESYATIIMYHRFGETNYPSTNITLKQLDKHILELSNKKYTVLPVKEIISAIQKGDRLPDRTVGITIDDGYSSVYDHAWPRFKKANLPFTVFIATDPIDRNSANYMNWDQIRALKKDGVEIGAHTSSHNHMPTSKNKHNQSELINSNSRMFKKIGQIPSLFAYPFGEASTRIQKQVVEAGYKMAFGQHSGVVNSSTDFNYIPRFSLNENYSSMERLRLILNALPLSIMDISPKDPMIKAPNPPDFGFTVSFSVKNLSQLSCFSSREGRLHIERIGQRIELRMSNPLPKGRTRINCTLPGPENRWRWLGHLFVVP
jgi:peptidoglycan/xylan/chitin deacetylase (PgdA/CDA1 family)